MLAQQMAAEASGGSGTSHATDDESGAPEGGAHDAQAVERSSKSLSALKPVCSCAHSLLISSLALPASVKRLQTWGHCSMHAAADAA